MRSAVEPEARLFPIEDLHFSVTYRFLPVGLFLCSLMKRDTSELKQIACPTLNEVLFAVMYEVW